MVTLLKKKTIYAMDHEPHNHDYHYYQNDEYEFDKVRSSDGKIIPPPRSSAVTATLHNHHVIILVIVILIIFVVIIVVIVILIIFSSLL